MQVFREEMHSFIECLNLSFATLILRFHLQIPPLEEYALRTSNLYCEYPPQGKAWKTCGYLSMLSAFYEHKSPRENVVGLLDSNQLSPVPNGACVQATQTLFGRTAQVAYHYTIRPHFFSLMFFSVWRGFCTAHLCQYPLWKRYLTINI